MKAATNRARSLKAQILTRVAPVYILLMAIIIVFTGRHASNTVRDETQLRVDNSATNVANAAESKLNLVLEACKAIARNDVIVNGTIDLEYRNSISKPFMRSLRLPGSQNQTVAMCDYRGRIIAGSDQAPSHESANWLPSVMSGDHAISIDELRLTLAVPVQYAGRPEGLIVATYPIEEFFSGVFSPYLDKVIAFELQGNVVATSDPRLVSRSTPFPTLDGWLKGSANLASLPSVRVSVLESEFVALRAANTVTMALLMMGVVMALGGIAAVWMTTSLLATKPLMGILEQIERVRSSGDLSSRVVETGASEFQQLGNRLNSMLAELELSTVSKEHYRMAQQRLEIALSGGDIGLWDWDAETGEIYFSDIYKAQLGFSAGVDWSTFDDFESRLHPDDRELVNQAVASCMSNGSPDYEATFRMRNKEGDYLWMCAKGLAEFGSDGKLRRMVGVHVDVSDRVARAQSLVELNAELERRAEELEAANKLTRASEERLDVAVRGTSDGLWDWNTETNEMWYSPRFTELLGYDSRDRFPHVLDSFTDRLHPDDKEETWAAITRHLEEYAPFDAQYRLQTKSGEYRWFRARGAAIRDRHGKAVRMSGSIQDISQQKRDRLILEQSNQELEQFAYVSSHDLQEPLRKVASFCELLEKEYGDVLEGDGKQYLTFVTDGARRMQTLIRDLLTFSRIKSQGMPLHETSADDAFQAAVENLEGAIEESDATISCDELPRVWADDRQMTQLLQNLIGNAIKYRGSEKPVIHVGYTETKDRCEISVSDNGIGIAPEDHDRVFGIFKRLHGRTEYSGTGIGLAICKRIVDRWQGEIWVESSGGSGSTFYFTVRKIEMGVPDAKQNYTFAN